MPDEGQGPELEVQGASFSSTFVIRGEDHTLGNALRYVLMRSPGVVFAGYTVPHPMESKIHVRVQTDGSLSARAALRDACATLSDISTHLAADFRKSVDDLEAAEQLLMQQQGNAQD